MVAGKLVPGKNGPRKTQKQKIVGWASSIVVCPECWDVIDLWKPKTQQQTQNSETNPKLGNKKLWGECRASWCVCVKCSDVINLWNPKTWQQTFLNSFSIQQFGAYVGSWGERQTSFCVCGVIKMKKSLKFPSILFTENNFWRTFFCGPIFRGPFFRRPFFHVPNKYIASIPRFTPVL